MLNYLEELVYVFFSCGTAALTRSRKIFDEFTCKVYANQERKIGNKIKRGLLDYVQNEQSAPPPRPSLNFGEVTK
jgi:hypothetical protein